MYVLGGWAAGNIIWGAVSVGSATGSNRYFHQMNLGWGIINGALAGMNILQLHKQIAKSKGLSFAGTIKEQQKLERLFLINAGLDVAYLGTGIWMKERSRTAAKKPERLKGFGNSLLLQGGFLLLFDGIMFSVHHAHGKPLINHLENLQVTAGLNGTGISIYF